MSTVVTQKVKNKSFKNKQQHMRAHTASLGLVLLLVLLLITYASCEVGERFFPEFKTKTSAPSQWKSLYKVNDLLKSNARLTTPFVTVTIALRHRNRDLLRDTVEKVSDPDSPHYGRHLTFEQVNDMVAPDPEHVDSVLSWLKSAHEAVEITRITPAKDFITAKIPVTVAQEMFQCEFTVFKHEGSDKTIVRTEGPYSIPRKLSLAIAFVGNLIRFPKVNSTRKVVESAVPVNKEVTPAVIREYYNITKNPVKPVGNNAQAVASFLEQYYNERDLQNFWNRFDIQHLNVKVIGPNPQDNPGLEAALDIEYITGVGEGIPTWFVSCPGLHDGQEVFLEWVINMTSIGDESPYVHSVSYGDIEDTISKEYADRLDDEFQKFGATGRTVLIASGDDGVRCNDAGNKFVPEWPTSSPWITAVGATQPDGALHQESSTSWSGGGFSNYYPTPKYQIEAIADYWAQPGIPSKSYYNVSGRAYPDVAAFGVNFVVAFKGSFTSVGGTSASTPTFAGIISLLNNARLSVNKKPLGFLNYVIYNKWSKVPNAFKDITVGRNGYSPCPGFICTPGWDPVTGFGTPNVGVLEILAKQL